MLLLSLETSCDETAAAVIEADQKNSSFRLLSNVVSSQIKIHAPWGGVVPMLAAREHLKNILPVVRQALKESRKTISHIDLLAVTQGPGLIPSLLLGVNAAKTLAYFFNLPLLGVHHIEGHLKANLINPNNTGDFSCLKYPVLSLVVSGGHTQLILEKSPRRHQIVGQTLDDAAGEAFDKVAKLLDLGYPGGPIVSQKAALAGDILRKQKNPTVRAQMEKIYFPRPMLQSRNLDFSFSGLKTSVLYFYQKILAQKPTPRLLNDWKAVICHQFQAAAVEVLAGKSLRAAQQFQPKTFLLAGGVAANQTLRTTLERELKEKFPQIIYQTPRWEFCGDNAAMIGVAGLEKYWQLKKSGRLADLRENWKNLVPDANLKLGD